MTEEQYLELVARLDDHDANLAHLMQQFGAAKWEHIVKQRKENAPQPPAPFHHDQRWGTNKS
jgi:hypothetical protein